VNEIEQAMPGQRDDDDPQVLAKTENSG